MCPGAASPTAALLSRYVRAAGAALAVVCCAVPALGALGLGPWLDHCHIDRSALVNPGPEWDFRHILFLRGSQVLVLTYLLELTLRGGAWRSLLLCTATLTWYFSSVLVLRALRVVLGDWNCLPKPNSVSGHNHMYVFWLLTLPLLTAVERGAARAPRDFSPAVHLGYPLYVVCLCFQMHRTYFEGFHTPRQLLYGLVQALVSHTLWALLLRHYYVPHRAHFRRRAGRVLLTWAYAYICIGALSYVRYTSHRWTLPCTVLVVATALSEVACYHLPHAHEPTSPLASD